MPTPLETIRKGEEEFNTDIKEYKEASLKDPSSTNDRLKPMILNTIELYRNRQKQTLKATLQALWDEAEGRKRDTPSLETCALLSREELQQVNLDVEHNQAIQTYQDSLLKLIKAI